MIEIGDRGSDVRKGLFVPIVTTLQIQLVGFWILRALLGDLLLLGTADLRTQLFRDVARNLLLQRDNICALAAVVLPPDFGVVPNIGKLSTDFHAVTPWHRSPADQRRNA